MNIVTGHKCRLLDLHPILGKYIYLENASTVLDGCWTLVQVFRKLLAHLIVSQTKCSRIVIAHHREVTTTYWLTGIPIHTANQWGNLLISPCLLLFLPTLFAVPPTLSASRSESSPCCYDAPHYSSTWSTLSKVNVL